MTEDEWLAISTPRKLLDRVLPCLHWERRMLLLSAACVRRFAHLISAQECRDALSAAEVAAEDAAEDATSRRRANCFRQLTAAHDAAQAVRRKSAIEKASTWAAFPNPTHGFLKASELVAVQAAGADPEAKRAEREYQCALIRDIFSNPFRPIAFAAEWRTSTVVAIAQQMYESRDFSAMPILADALQDAGCDNDDILNHCRDANGVHVRGCWVVDLVLGKS